MNPKDLPLSVWEALCRQCGKCCTEKVVHEGKIYMTAKYCRFLNTETKRCEVYSNRFAAEPDCTDVPTGVKHGIFPPDCPYVKDIEGYEGAIENWDSSEVTELVIELLGEDALPD